MAGEIDIGREIGQVTDALTKLAAVGKENERNLKEINKNLKLDPTNVTLLAERSEVMGNKLQNAKDRAEALQQQIGLLNQGIADGTYTQEQAGNAIAEYERKLTSTKREIEGLTGATQEQIKISKTAEETTKSFSTSMTEFQNNLRAVNQVMGGVIQGYELLGGDKDSAIGKTLQQSQKSIQMMNGVLSMNKLLSGSNSALAKSFGTVAISAGAAVAAYSLGSSIINAFGEDNRKIASIVAITAGAVGALAIAGLAAAGALSWGAAIPGIVAAVGLGTAGMSALLKKETKTLQEAQADFEMPSGSTSTPATPSTNTPSTSSTPRVPTTPSVPTYSGGGGSVQSQTIIQTLSEKQIESAVYAAVDRAIIDTGLNQKQFIGTAEINNREFARFIFNDLLAINNERGNPLKI